MSDIVERLARAIKSAWDAEMTAEAEASGGFMDYEPGPWEDWVPEAKAALAAMQTDAAPALKPAVEVWREASDAATDGSVKYQSHADQAAAAVIEADRAAIIAAKDAEIAALQAYADALAEYAVHQPDCRVGQPDCLGEEELCTCGLSNTISAYEEFRRD